MLFSIIFWSLLVAIGVSDAKLHRIPNKLLLLLLGLICLSVVTQEPRQDIWQVIGSKSTAFVISFSVGLALFFLRVMAPGDVKLISVLGFLLGTSELVGYVYYVCLIIVFVGPMYWFLNRLYLVTKIEVNKLAKGKPNNMDLTKMAISLELGKEQVIEKVTSRQNLTYMPFAPILVMGLALQQYYS